MSVERYGSQNRGGAITKNGIGRRNFVSGISFS